MFQVLSHFERCPGFDKKRYVKKIAGGVYCLSIESIIRPSRYYLSIFIIVVVRHTETKPRFKGLSERLEKLGIELTTPGFQDK